jgi:hypothetical protein
MEAGLRSLGTQALRHPFLITAPLAASAISMGFASQALLQPAVVSQKADVLDALMAPAPEKKSPADTPLPAGQGASLGMGSDPGSLQARRIGSVGGGAPVPKPESGNGVNLEIRVALLKVSSQPRVGGDGGWRVLSREGQLIRQGDPGEALAADLLGSLAEVWVEPGSGGGLQVDGRPYAGRLRLLRAGNGIQVVNHLPLESYVSSVVGGEMPTSWRLEALRAQAVAARSYAMAHMARPANDHWHLGDTTRWQNYEGLRTVSDPTLQATNSTAGVILSYQGGIVESLYAATQQIVDEAHSHLGASMSQTGAQELAQQGLKFNEILSHYYQGASLARLQVGAS